MSARADASIEVSVVIPTLEEEANVAAIADAVRVALAAAGVASYELLFIDNGSTDRTVPIVKDLCRRDARVRLIVNTRNFGQMRSPTHAIYQTRGRAVIGMCCDFQDPPELLPELVRRWRDGHPIVLGVREAERASLPLRIGRAIAYAFVRRYGDYPVISGATGFGLYDRVVVDTVAAWHEPEPYFRGMLVESGFPITTIPYRRPARLRGKSKNDAAALLAFAISALASSSKKLLRVPLFLAAGLTAVALPVLVASPLAWALGGPGGTLLVTGLVTFGFALVFLFLGLLGEQLRLVSERTRSTPLVVEKERVNF